MRDPVFVSGLRKSGTSLVKNLLDDHPKLFTYPPNEQHFFRYSALDSVVKDKRDRIDEPTSLLDRLANIDFVPRMNEESAGDYRPQVDIEKFDNTLEGFRPGSYPEVYESLFESMATASSHVKGVSTGGARPRRPF